MRLATTYYRLTTSLHMSLIGPSLYRILGPSLYRILGPSLYRILGPSLYRIGNELIKVLGLR